MRPEQVTPEDARELWPRVLAVNPSYDRFRVVAGRDLPLVRLRLADPDERRHPA
jgi:hypothetical protein